jgi:succinoglycan biosynthesis protein ExoA
MQKLPFVSVVMPVRNEEAFIARSLSAVLRQDYPRELMEVVVADGMSTDRTREIVNTFADAGAPVRLVDNPGRIAPSGLNAAIRHAAGEIIVRVDGHCEVAADYVRQCVARLGEGRAEAVGGPIETVGETVGAQAIALAMSSRFGVGGSSFRTVKDREMFTDTVAFPAYRREVIERVGWFDEELVRNQDDEYNYRLRKLGGRLLLSPLIRSRYYSRASLRSLWRQYFQYGFWKVRVTQKHPAQMRPRQFVPTLFVLLLLLLLLPAPFLPYGWAPAAAALSAYAAANLGCSAWLAWRARRWRYALFLPACFAALHFGYGLGYLTGLLKFRNRWAEARPARRPHPLRM